jgi:MarR family multiple antibiotic resistance transcriptional regulator
MSSTFELFEAVVRYETEAWNAVDAALRAGGAPSLAVTEALRLIRARGASARVQDLALDLGITPGAASKFVDRLEQQGLVQRNSHPTDRRSSLVALTEAGLRAENEGSTEAERIVDRQLGALVPEAHAAELTTLFVALRNAVRGSVVAS